jgi:hypothetical protein
MLDHIVLGFVWHPGYVTDGTLRAEIKQFTIPYAARPVSMVQVKASTLRETPLVRQVEGV